MKSLGEMQKMAVVGVALSALVVGCAEGEKMQPAQNIKPDAKVDAPTTPDAKKVDAKPDAPVVVDAPLPDATILPDAPIVDAAPDAPVVDAPIPIDAPPPPPEDTCLDAPDITTLAKASGGYVTTSTNTGFYHNANACFSYSGQDHVYRIDVAAGDILTVIANPLSDDFDMGLAIVNGCVAQESCVGTKDTGYDGDQEFYGAFMETAGSLYIYVDGYSSTDIGDYKLNVILTTPAS